MLVSMTQTLKTDPFCNVAWLGRSVHYMASQYLADSSLSEDVSQYDFSTPIQVN